MSDHVPALLRWILAHDLPKVALLACDHSDIERAPRGTQVIVWDSCLKDASIGIPVQLLALGIELVEVLGCSVNPDEVSAQVDSWESLTPGLVTEVATPRRTLLRGPEILELGMIAMPRRTMLGLSSRDKQPIPIKADNTTRTLSAIELLTAKGLIKRGTGLASQLGGVRLGSTGCTACGVCVKACPHGALTLEHHEGQSDLWQISELCRADQACVRLCPVDALWVQGEMRLSDLLDDPQRHLETLYTARCTRCGMRHPADEGPLCKTCSFKSENPFGSTMMPRP